MVENILQERCVPTSFTNRSSRENSDIISAPCVYVPPNMVQKCVDDLFGGGSMEYGRGIAVSPNLAGMTEIVDLSRGRGV